VDRFRLLAARAATLVLAAVLLHGVVRLGLKAFRYLVSPFSRDYGEGCVLAMVQLLHERGTYFTDLRDYPFVHGNYPPVFIALVWPFHAAFGPSLLAPRAISMLATLALLVALFVLLRRLAASPGLAAALVGVALCPWFVQSWAPMGRVDMVAFFFSIAGLALAVGGATGKALPFFWLAFFTKQNAVLAPLAWLVHVAMDGPPARVSRAAAAYLLPLLALFGLLAAATGGEAYRHLVPYTAAAEYEWGRMAESYVELARVAWPLLVSIAAGLVREPRAFASGPRRAIFIYWLLNLAGLATIAKAGAAQNYFIEPWLATVLMAATAITVLFQAASPFPWRPLVLAGIAAVALYTNAEGHRLPPSIRHPERARDFQDLWTIVRTTPGPILSENLSVLAVNGRPVLVEPFGMLLLAQKGIFSTDRLVDDCMAGRFTLIVGEHRLERIPGLAACLEKRYAPWQDLATYRLFRPRSGD
jgi:hypothetical protein